METVIAVLFAILSNGNLELVATKKVPYDQCISEAREINASDEHPYVLLCGPDLSVETYES